MKKVIIFALLLSTLHLFAQEIRVVDNKGTLKIANNNQVTTSATAPVDPVESDLWFDNSTTPTLLKVWDGSTTWIPYGADFWSIKGNTGTNAATDFIGTTDNQDFILKSNNIEEIRLLGANGQVLINQATNFNNHPLVIRANGADVLAFQDATGTPKYHWNLISGGLNFVESFIADYRLFLEPGGNIGINTNNPDAMLDINTVAGAPNAIPIRIRPNTATPTGTAAGQFHVASDGLLYTYDAVRLKWLSVDRNMIGWGRNGNAQNNYLRQFNGATSNTNGWRMIRDATITAITVQSNTNQTFTVQIRKNDDTAVIASLTVNAAQGDHDTTINVDVNEGDFLQCFLSSTVNVSSPQVLIEVAWRQ